MAAASDRAREDKARLDAAFARQVGDALSAAGLNVTRTALADLQVPAAAPERVKAGAGQAA